MQNTDYELRISDGSSDVCSSVLPRALDVERDERMPVNLTDQRVDVVGVPDPRDAGRVEQVALSERVGGHGPPDEAGPPEGGPAVVTYVGSLPQTLLVRERRSAERRVGKECVSKCRSRWSPEN